jgi:hypothetical protein
MNQEEIWKAVAGYEGHYEVSNLGRVKSLARKVISRNRNCSSMECCLQERMLSPSKGQYFVVTLMKEGRGKNTYLHRIIAKAFIPNPFNLPMVNHIDGDKLNNSLDNLEWCTDNYNRRHAIRLNGTERFRGENNNQAKLTKEQVIKIREICAKEPCISYGFLSRIYGVTPKYIGAIVARKTWSHI